MSMSKSFNTTTAPFDDVTVWNAVAKSIDKKHLCKTVYNGMVSPPSRILPAYYAYCDIDTYVKSYSLEAAKRLLEHTGYVDSDGDDICEKMENLFPSPCLMW